MLFFEDRERSRRVDEATVVTPILELHDFPFDVVRTELNGPHPAVVNHASDRVYYFLRGRAEVRVGARTHVVRAGELVAVRSGEVHALVGDAEFLVITSPPFDVRNEERIED